jgi:hypothetical protein
MISPNQISAFDQTLKVTGLPLPLLGSASLAHERF